MAEERPHKWATISVVLAILSMQVYFVYMMANGLMRTPIEVIIKWGLPMGIIPLLVFFSTDEILGWRRFHRSRELCLKRFFGRFLLCLLLFVPLLLLLIVASLVGLFTTAQSGTFTIALVGGIGLAYFALVILLMSRLKEALTRFVEGSW